MTGWSRASRRSESCRPRSSDLSVEQWRGWYNPPARDADVDHHGIRMVRHRRFDRGIGDVLPPRTPAHASQRERRPWRRTPRLLVGSTLVADPAGGVALLTLERRRDAEGKVEDLGHRVITWRTGDAGATWEQLPAGRPRILEGGNQVAWFPAADGARWILQATTGPPVTVTLRRSEAGPPDDPTTCLPGPGAACSFTELGAIDLAGRDLRGIELNQAQVVGANLDGADLTGADLRDSDIVASMRDTRLVDVRARGAELEGDLAGADLTGADLSFVKLMGPATRIADARALDLRRVTLGYTSLIRLDLTGAQIDRAQAKDLSFIEDVTCPDGEPSAVWSDPDPCRLKAVR